ncbi:FtsX-like permease family protein [Candidatus Poribacteria bacterium]|nr:FtsX-like permease family protein [Candidatus Poribacteria bacterium]MYH80820.1 FtsX-like permease family protein [Candidatus Poribacteria bacterium]
MPRFSWNSLKHFWQIHVVVALCTAVATGVLAGALIVGDSVRGSLRSLTTERLGAIQHVLLADHFFQPDLLQRENKVPAVLLNGTIVAPQTQTRASKVNIAGVTDDFFRFWQADPAPNLNEVPEQPFNPIVINEALQNELNVQVGDSLLVNMSQAADIHPEFLLGERDAANAIQSLRLVISDIIPTKNAGRFSLQAHQSLPFNAFIALPVLQKALGQGDKVNAVFTADTDAISAADLPLTLDALGLRIKTHENHFDLQSQQYLLEPLLSETALTVVTENRIPTLPTLTYLANTITANDKAIPYSTIIALPTDEGEFAKLLNMHTTEAQHLAYEQARKEKIGQVTLEIDKLKKEKRKLRSTKKDREQANKINKDLELLHKSLRDSEIILNRWAAEDLGASVGDIIEVTYYSVSTDEAYITETVLFRLKGILPIEGITADRDIIPEFPGIHDTADMSEWESPFPIDYTLVREKDETYWDEYGATPKAFIPLQIGKRLWKNRFGDLTTIRIGTASDADIQATRTLFETEFLKKIQPEQVGFQFLSPQADGLQASTGATDFGMLFGSLSGFIIIAVALLVAMLFRIGVEQRSREIGLLQAVGYPLAKIRRRFLYEGATVAGIGSLLGCLFAVGYAQLMIFGLQTWWLPAIGTPFMELHVNLLSLITGILIALVVVMVSIRLIVQQLGQIPTTALLAGETDSAEITLKRQTQKTKSSTLSFIVKNVVITLAVVVFAFFIFFDRWFSDTFGIWVEAPIIDFLIFTLSVIGVGWDAFGRWLKSQRVPKRLNRIRFALKNAARQPGRSTTSVKTISLACCIIVAVGANRHDASPESEYAFVAESALPLHHSLNTPEGRFELGFSEETAELLSKSEIFPFRVLPGEDVSCLNLYQPQKPQILGAPNAMLDGYPWSQIRVVQPEGGRAPAIGDMKSLRWILHHNPDEDFIVQDEFGKPLRLELETIENSLFQSQLIISESNFTKYFPSQSGYQFFLIKTPPELREETAQVLEKTLGDYGFDLTSASARLASYRAVENTYISTFQSLGGLGVLLGTFGLALILFRNIIERRGELATLRAFGFRRQLLSRMLFLESCFLLTVGMLIGIVAGLVAILGSQGYLPSFPWVSLTITLLFIFGFGIIANAIAVAVALRSPLLSTLKSE